MENIYGLYSPSYFRCFPLVLLILISLSSPSLSSSSPLPEAANLVTPKAEIAEEEFRNCNLPEKSVTEVSKTSNLPEKNINATNMEPSEEKMPLTNISRESDCYRPWLHTHSLRNESDKCWSRSEGHLYRSSVSDIKPSSTLAYRISAYLERYKQCWHGPSDWPYVVGDFQGREMGNFSRLNGCTYAMVDLHGGLGNRLVGFVSIFIWALLTDRVFLVSDPHMQGNLCDFPAPASSWWVPKWDQKKKKKKLPNGIPYSTLLSLQNVIKLTATNNEGPKRAASLDLGFKSSDMGYFFCEETQLALQQHTKTVIIRSGQFFATGLWLVPSMAEKLLQLFPDRFFFNHIAHYILNPNNLVWSQITRMYRSNYADAEKRIGMQIRTLLKDDTGVPPVVLDCAVNISKVLPSPSPVRKEAELKPSQLNQSENASAYLQKAMPKMTSVFIASLSRDHATYLQKVYKDGLAQDGTHVVIRSESTDTFQDASLAQARRAYAEMWLLGLSNKLLISAESTFGYIAAGLAHCQTYSLNIRNWRRSQKKKPCNELIGRDPCFQHPPHTLMCSKHITLKHILSSPLESLPSFPFFKECSDKENGLVVV